MQETQEKWVQPLSWEDLLEKEMVIAPVQYPYLENPMDRGDWRATVHRVTKNQTRWKRLSQHARVGIYT